MFLFFLYPKINTNIGGYLGFTHIERKTSQKKDEDEEPASITIPPSSKKSLIGSAFLGVSRVSEEFIFDVQGFVGMHIFSKCKNDDFKHLGFVGIEGACLYRFEPWLAIGVLAGVECDFFKSLNYDFHLEDDPKNNGAFENVESEHKPFLNYIVGAKLLFKANDKITLCIKYQYFFNTQKIEKLKITEGISGHATLLSGHNISMLTNYAQHRIIFGIEYNLKENE